MSVRTSSDRDVCVVSGLPRSGTSMMMRMLEAGGVPILSDGERRADDDNPRGYFELEAVKTTARDASWLDAAAGRAVKVISALLADLPEGPSYRVVFMRRNLDEVLASQSRMLERRGKRAGEPDEQTKELLVDHLAQVEEVLRARQDMEVLFVSYRRTVEEPRATAERLRSFLARELDVEAMCAAVEPSLYRQREDDSRRSD
jgi:hypothetical protein